MQNRSIDMPEEWIEMKQYNIPKGQFIVRNFTQDMDEVKIVLDDGHNTVIEVVFDGMPLLWRIVDKAMKINIWNKDEIKLIKGDIFLYEIKNSQLTQWAIEEGCGFYEKSQFTHYRIAVSEKVVDVLSMSEPIVKIINAKVDTTFYIKTTGVLFIFPMIDIIMVCFIIIKIVIGQRVLPFKNIKPRNFNKK